MLGSNGREATEIYARVMDTFEDESAKSTFCTGLLFTDGPTKVRPSGAENFQLIKAGSSIRFYGIL